MKKLIYLVILLVACDPGNKATQPAVEEGDLFSSTPETQSDSGQNVEGGSGSNQSTSPIILSDYRDDCWHLAQVKTAAEVTTISNSSITCFESHSEEDLSPNGQVSLLHALERGELEDGDKVTSIEKYACYFINIRSADLSDAHTDTMCSGEWDAESMWVVDEQEIYSIAELF